MSKYSKEEQTEIVRLAMTLQAAIESEEKELRNLEAQRFGAKPNAPIHKRVNQAIPVIAPKYPPVPKTDYSFSTYLDEERKKVISTLDEKRKKAMSTLSKRFSTLSFKRKLLAILAGVALLAIFIILLIVFKVNPIVVLEKIGAIFLVLVSILASFVPVLAIVLGIICVANFSKKRSELNQALANAPEYLRARADAEKKAAEQQAALKEEMRIQQEKLDLEYAKEKEHYDSVIVPKYQKELAAWETKQNKKIQMVSEDLKENKQALQSLYEQTGLIAKTFRTLQKLVWLYEDMSTSEHDIERATDLLNANMQLAATRGVSSSIEDMDRNMRIGFNQVYDSIERGNDLLSESCDLLSGIDSNLSKARKDMRNFNSAAIVQRHMTNKHIKTANKQFAEFSKKFD